MEENEILPIVDKDGKVIGKATRKACHQHKNLIHPVIHCWIFNGKGQILLQKRAMTKKIKPGYWDISCGGHVLYGETCEYALLRELEEEIGVQKANPLLFKTELQFFSQQTEFVSIYYAIIDQPLHYFTMQIDEVDDLQWIDREIIETESGNNDLLITQSIRSEVIEIFKSGAYSQLSTLH